MSKSGGAIAPLLHPGFDGPASYRVEADNEWLTKEDRSYCDTINRDELLFFPMKSHFPPGSSIISSCTQFSFSVTAKRGMQTKVWYSPLYYVLKFEQNSAISCSLFYPTYIRIVLLLAIENGFKNHWWYLHLDVMSFFQKFRVKPSISSHLNPRTRRLKCFVLNRLCSKIKHLRYFVQDLVQSLND